MLVALCLSDQAVSVLVSSALTLGNVVVPQQAAEVDVKSATGIAAVVVVAAGVDSSQRTDHCQAAAVEHNCSATALALAIEVVAGQDSAFVDASAVVGDSEHTAPTVQLVAECMFAAPETENFVAAEVQRVVQAVQNELVAEERALAVAKTERGSVYSAAAVAMHGLDVDTAAVAVHKSAVLAALPGSTEVVKAAAAAHLDIPGHRN